MAPPKAVHAHCDLPCGVYDPAQARVEAESVKAIMEKSAASEDAYFKERAVVKMCIRDSMYPHHH